MTLKRTLSAMIISGIIIAPALAETEINVVGSIGVLSMYKSMEKPFWTETIPEVSGGEIKASIKPFNELGFKGGELFNLVSDGTVQIAHQVLPYTAGAIPANESMDIVGVAKSVEEVQKAANAYRATHTAMLADKHNIKLLGYGTYHSQVVYCRDAFTGMDDLKGRKIRAAGASQQVFVEYIGASPIGMAFGEVPTAMANGTIDCAITGALSGYLAKWHEPAGYISAMPVNHGIIAHIANLDWWNGLDAKTQTTLETNLADLETKMFTLAATETADGLACNSGGECAYGEPADLVLVPVSDADTALRTEATTKAVLPAFKTRCGDECATSWNATIGAELGYKIN